MMLGRNTYSYNHFIMPNDLYYLAYVDLTLLNGLFWPSSQKHVSCVTILWLLLYLVYVK